MELTNRDFKDIDNVINERGCNNAIEIMTFKNDISIFCEPQVFESSETFIQALKDLKNFKFENALNGQIGLSKINDEHNSYHIQIKVFENVEFASQILF